MPGLPYPVDGLEPFISVRSMAFHHGHVHKRCVEMVNMITHDSQPSEKSLEQLIRESNDEPSLSINAALAWSHDFFWKSMKPGGGGRPNAQLLEKIARSFGSFEGFRMHFIDEGGMQLGSGWIWLVQDGPQLKIVRTNNADTPIKHDQNPLFVCDLWEHTYYLDYQNRRRDFLQIFVDHLINWDFAVSQLKGKASLP